MELKTSYDLDFVFRVDRSVSFTFPPVSYFESFSGFDRPDLQCSGPSEYDLKKDVEQLLPDTRGMGGEIDRDVDGVYSYDLLKKMGLVRKALNLQDGVAIMEQRGFWRYRVFKEVFVTDTGHNKTLLLWASVGHIFFDQRPMSAVYGSYLAVPFVKIKPNGDPCMGLVGLGMFSRLLFPVILFK
jgi:hypothetical protein